MELIAALAPGGRLVSYGLLDDRPFEMRAATVLFRNLLWQGFGLDNWRTNSSQETLALVGRGCWELLADQPQRVPVAGRFALDDFQAAFAPATRAPWRRQGVAGLIRP